MTFPDIIFYIVAAIIIITASSAVFSTRVKSALRAAAACMLTITIIFFLLGNDYTALIHLLIYALVTSGIIIYSFYSSGSLNNIFSLRGSYISLLIIAVFSALVAGNLLSTKWKETAPLSPGSSIWETTKLVQTDYFLPMMVLGVIIFIGVIGSLYITKKN